MFVPILRANYQHGLRHEIICYTPRAVPWKVHFAGQTKPCLKPYAGKCELCKKQPARIVSYLAGHHLTRRQDVIIELTAKSIDLLPQVDLRGWKIIIQRDIPKAPLQVHAEQGHSTPAAINLAEILKWIWGIDRKPRLHSIEPAKPVSTKGQSLAAIERQIRAKQDPRLAGDFQADEYRSTAPKRRKGAA